MSWSSRLASRPDTALCPFGRTSLAWESGSVIVVSFNHVIAFISLINACCAGVVSASVPVCCARAKEVHVSAAINTTMGKMGWLFFFMSPSHNAKTYVKIIRWMFFQPG